MSARAEWLERYRAPLRRYRPDRRTFERLVAQTLDGLPSAYRERLINVAVVIAERPTSAELQVSPDPERDDLLGLYEGVPYGERGTAYHLVPPDRITIYREPILAVAATPAAVRAEIRTTVLHEIGHYFGLTDAELDE